jgi:manganese efflux pump family protein
VRDLLALALAACAVGLGNFAVAIGIGLSGVSGADRLRVGVIFGVFESGMPVIGLVLGAGVAHRVGTITRYGGGILLILIGLWTIARSMTSKGTGDDAALPTGNGRLVLTAFALSVDNLVIGFSLGVQQVPLIAAIVIFAVVSIGLALLGLEFGSRLGARFESGTEQLAGITLVCVGALVVAGVL